jgi:predicted ATPase
MSLRLTRLAANNWMNFQSFNIALSQRAFFVGPNASGKSNLLDLVRFLRDLVVDGGGLQEAVRRRGGVSAIRSLSARRQPNIEVIAVLGTDEVDEMWTYELGFGSDKKLDGAVILHERVVRGSDGKVLFKRPMSADGHDPERLSQTFLQQVNANKEFRDIATAFASVRYLHAVPQLIRDPDLQRGASSFGSDLIARIQATPEKTRQARLKRMQDALSVAVPRLAELKIETDARGVPHLSAKYRHWRPHGAWQRQDKFSDGTLRLLGLVWSLQEGGGLLLLEEPELSLNAGVVARLAPVISRAVRKSKTQVLMTTHSADLLSENVRLDEIYCLRVQDEGTTIVAAETLEDVRHLVEAGLPVGEAIMPKTRADELDQLGQLELSV